MAFVCHVAGLTRFINGQPVHLCIGGVRAYNEDKLFGRESPMEIQDFCGLASSSMQQPLFDL